MPAPRVVNRLSAPAAAYIAGIVDGEGTVTLSRSHKQENKRLYSERHRPAFTYQVSSRQALDLLRQIVPYMKSYKVRRATLALKRYVDVTPRNGKYTAALRVARATFEREFLALRAK